MIAREPHTPVLLFGGFGSAVLVIRTIARPGVSPRTGVRGGGRGETFARGSGTAVDVGDAADHGVARDPLRRPFDRLAGAGPRDRPLAGPPGEGGCGNKRLGQAPGAANARVGREKMACRSERGTGRGRGSASAILRRVDCCIIFITGAYSLHQGRTSTAL